MRHMKDYRIISIPLGIGAAAHTLYVKQNADRFTGDDAMGQVLYVGNVDYGCSRSLNDIDSYLRLLFDSFGEVENVSVCSFDHTVGGSWYQNEIDGLKDLQHHQQVYQTKEGESAGELPANARFAHVKFSDPLAVKSVLDAPNSMYDKLVRAVVIQFGAGNMMYGDAYSSAVSSSSDKTGGSKRYRTSREIAQLAPLVDVQHATLKSKVNDYVAQFEEKEQIALALRNKQLNEMDADGFMPVKHRKKVKRVDAINRARRGGKNQRSRSGGGVRSVMDEEDEGVVDESGMANQAPSGFYRHQMRNEKQTKLINLRKQFEADKEKIASMKAQRVFKPF